MLMMLRRFTPLYTPLYLLVCVLTSVLIFGLFLRDPGIVGDAGASFYEQIDSSAHRPYVYRALLPLTARSIRAVVPESVRADLVDWAFATDPVVDLFEREEWLLRSFVEFAIAIPLMYLSFLGFMWALRDLAGQMFHASRYLLDAVPLIGLLCLPPFFTATNYVYDPPTLMLFTAGLALMERRSWSAYLIVFLLACINKETTLLLTVIFVLVSFTGPLQLERRRFWLLLAAQILIVLLARLILMSVFAGNPGGAVNFTLFKNVFLLTGQTYTLPEVVTWIGVILLLFYRWPEKPLFLRRGLWILLPLFGLMLFFGLVNETRVFYEVYPLALLLALHTVAQVLDLPLAARGEAAA